MSQRARPASLAGLHTAHNAQIWTVSALIRIQLTSAQITRFAHVKRLMRNDAA